MKARVPVECVGGLWDGRWIDTPVNEHGELAQALRDDAGKPVYRLVFDRCVIASNFHHEYENPRFVPAVA